MSENQAKSSGSGKAIKLCLLIVAVLLVPIVMDQVNVDRDSVKWAGRAAGGATGLMFLYGIFTKVLRVLAFVVIALIGTVVLVSEGHIKAPRVQEWFSAREKGK